MQEMYLVYKKYFTSGLPISKDLLSEKIEHMQQNLALTLAVVNDSRIVKAELKELKKERIYPYQRNFLGNSTQNIVLNFLLKKEFGFWIIHFLSKIKLLLSRQ